MNILLYMSFNIILGYVLCELFETENKVRHVEDKTELPTREFSAVAVFIYRLPMTAYCSRSKNA
jgi:hypothetical protein